MKLRRIVTGHDAQGRAGVWRDDRLEGRQTPVDKIKSRLIWSTDAVPADYLWNEDMGERQIGVQPPAGGTRFAMIEIEPGNAAYLHRTDSIDYIVCIVGEVEMELDAGAKVKLAAGEVMVQRGTNHAWVNRGTGPCRLAVILVDGKPKRAAR